MSKTELKKMIRQIDEALSLMADTVRETRAARRILVKQLNRKASRGRV